MRYNRTAWNTNALQNNLFFTAVNKYCIEYSKQHRIGSATHYHYL